MLIIVPIFFEIFEHFYITLCDALLHGISFGTIIGGLLEPTPTL